MSFNSASFFTLQLKVAGKKIGELETIEIKDLTYDQMTARMLKVYTMGVSVETAPTCRELISPFRITTCFIIEQKSKIGEL